LVAAQTGAALSSLVHRVLALRAFMRWRVPRAVLGDGLRTLPDVIRFGLKIAPGGVADGISVDSATWVLGATGTTAMVGAYNRAYLLGRRLMDVNWRVNEVLFPTLVERRANGDRDGFDRVLVDSLRYVAVLLLAPAAAVGGAAQAVMAVFGPGFDRGAGALALLMLLPVLATGSNVLRHVLYAAGRPWLGTASGVLRMLVSLAVVVPLARALGPTGAALAVVAGVAVDVCFAGALARRELSRSPLELWPPRQLLATGLAYVAGFGAARGALVLLPGLGGLVPALLGGLVVYAGVLIIAGGVGPRDRARLAALLSKAHARVARPVAAGAS
jgi:O-antigen/teichoic acid export membrane protein